MAESNLGISLLDAAKNCQRDGAMAVLYLRGSGLRFEGKLEKLQSAGQPTVHMALPGGGWATIERDEIAAVETQHG